MPLTASALGPNARAGGSPYHGLRAHGPPITWLRRTPHRQLRPTASAPADPGGWIGPGDLTGLQNLRPPVTGRHTHLAKGEETHGQPHSPLGFLRIAEVRLRAAYVTSAAFPSTVMRTGCPNHGCRWSRGRSAVAGEIGRASCRERV